ncbi:glutamate synthase large subunit [Geothrix sp. 21YS21S-2]|uniref:glutamate synthase large subunit n=1 Tax=Geothrix sp. 21YS21S-2 TaxID=3068893 RepID=UPI0027B8EC24|nr:glutamate synthase large subunit [Geothrix sp. 21YS21S-2]
MSLPPRQGLYDPSFEHDACGLGFVATLNREASHDIVAKGLEILANLTHRGAAGSDPLTGDGAGILLQIPHQLYKEEMAAEGVDLPEPGDYAVAMCFFSADPAECRHHYAILEAAVMHYGQTVIGWRTPPTVTSALGPTAVASMPSFRQLFIGRRCQPESFEQVLCTIRKMAGRNAKFEHFFICSCSSLTVVYKGLMLAEQLAAFFPDLADPRTRSRLAMVHSRFSTNTFPAWKRAHPYRLLAHNGEINTLRGNLAWMSARESNLAGPAFSQQTVDAFRPIARPDASDSQALDQVVDFLHQGSGRSLPHVMMMLVPEAWTHDPDMSPEKKAFYEYAGCLLEPWDGPAALAFTDGRLIGATLDRNGLRPAKYVVTSDGLVVVASEFGVLDLDPATIVQKGRLQPGKMFLVDTLEGRLVSDEEIKHQVASAKPYAAWLAQNKIDLASLPPAPASSPAPGPALTALQQAFGYTEEDLRIILAPMGAGGEEPVGSMGVDIPLAVLSARPQLLFRYFKQHFAQVTNPPIDPIREEIVMSSVTCVGGEGNLMEESPRQCRMLELPHPFLTDGDLAKLRANPLGDFKSATLPMFFHLEGDPERNLFEGIRTLCRAASRCVADGISIVILSDRGLDERRAPIPSLLATAAVHHHLIREGTRTRVGLIVESGEPREVAHMAALVGFGAGAVNPYLALATLRDLCARGVLAEPGPKAEANYIKALKKGLLKTMAKMGISTLSSYQGAQIFEAIGIDQFVIDEYFTGTASRVRGIGLRDLAEETLARHAGAFDPDAPGVLEQGGHFHYRVDGERHLWNPETIASLQKAVRLEDAGSYEAFARAINDQVEYPATLRGLWDLVPAGDPVPLSEVEPASEIVRRFATGAMSFGSISKEAHENIAIAMNRMGGRSNTGEGGEDPARFAPDPNGDLRRSAIKQVASGRFGVTAEYLADADEIQIKMAQGAKPGEGGQLPGAKVDATIAKVRHSMPGVTLISPPPHHDIYSIEDLAQLIFDLKNVNPRARISVKLVSEAGVGTIAAGVVKAHADVVLISGDNGGTGASPLTAIHHSGVPWELGLAEAHQVLVLNDLRSRAVLQTDGKLNTGRDVAVAALLGAEEFGFSTAPLVASGCIMMRKCHLNTCPVGVATQDPVLRAKFAGQPEHVIRYFFYVAEELRGLMASLGFRDVRSMVGRSDCLKPRREGLNPKARKVDCSEILHRSSRATKLSGACAEAQDHKLDDVLDHELIRQAMPALEAGTPVVLETRVRNSDRATGAMLSGEIARRLGGGGLPPDTIRIRAAGSAGQSFGAFASPGMTLELVGDANDYVGKGLCGGVVAVRPHPRAPFRAEDMVIVGNVVLYGATSGRAFFNGRAGERFAIRNSGATTVVEGVGDHGCEYMTGGLVVVLGTVGRNFAAGMSGGLAYVLDEDGTFAGRCNKEMVELLPLGGEDALRVRNLLAEHVERTGSVKAAEVLADWDARSARFVKVYPSEYRRALEAAASPATNGLADLSVGVK